MRWSRQTCGMPDGYALRLRGVTTVAEAARRNSREQK
jgi:hypothetical protein